MTKVNSSSSTGLIDSSFKANTQPVDKKEVASSLLSKNDTLSIKYPKSDNIRQTKEFKTVFPNFDALDQNKQVKVMQKINLYMAKYPDFLTKLSKIDNPKYGDGFQFFFVPEKDNTKYSSSTALIGKAMGKTASGIVFGGTAGVLENSILKNSVAKISQVAVNNGIMGHKFDNSKISLDVGGMYTNSSEDTFAHEMGHVVNAYFMSNNERLELWSIYAEAKDSGKFPSEYSKTNNMEFFSEGVESYLKQDNSGKFTEREQLKNQNPDLYKFVAKEVDPDVKKLETLSTAKSVGILGEYAADGLYNKSKIVINNTYSKTKKLLGLSGK